MLTIEKIETSVLVNALNQYDCNGDSFKFYFPVRLNISDTNFQLSNYTTYETIASVSCTIIEIKKELHKRMFNNKVRELLK